jgi:hypothetical protein
MKTIFTTLSIVIYSTLAFSQSDNDTIYWSASYKLKWEDFKGNPDSTSQFGAISYPGIKYSLSANEDSFNTKVICFFIKSKSWVRVYSSHGLTHEQGHFDIAELFARKLRKAFAEYKFNYSTIGKDIDKLFLINKQERNKMDILYDKETDFSRNKQQQLQWNNKLKIQLEKFEKYASR